MSMPSAPITAHRPPHVEPQYRRELVPVRPAASEVVQHATRITRTALDMYPGDAASQLQRPPMRELRRHRLGQKVPAVLSESRNRFGQRLRVFSWRLRSE